MAVTRKAASPTLHVLSALESTYPALMLLMDSNAGRYSWGACLAAHAAQLDQVKAYVGISPVTGIWPSPNTWQQSVLALQSAGTPTLQCVCLPVHVE